MTSIRENIAEIRKSLDAASGARTVRLIAVSKTVGTPEMEAAVAGGIQDFGESRIQEATRKFAENPFPGITRHFIGTIQSNKVHKLTEHFQWFHGLDSLEIARKIAAGSSSLQCLIQVNTSGEASKSGLQPEDVCPFVESLSQIQGLNIKGLMTIGPNSTDTKLIKASFSRLVAIQKECRQYETESFTFNELSMGMSGDYLLAVEAGATMVRIGSRIFGART